MWPQEEMKSVKELLRWHKNTDVVPALKVMQKLVEFCHIKCFDMLKQGCTLPNLAKSSLNISTSSEFCPFTESDEKLLSKGSEDEVGCPSIVFMRKTVVHETHIRKSTNACQSIVGIGINASQFYPYSMCQPMPTGLYTRYQFDADLQFLKPRLKKSRSFDSMAMS